MRASKPGGARSSRRHRRAPGWQATTGSRWLTDKNFARIEALTDFATGSGRTVGALALAWLASQRVVCSVIAGATRPEQVRENVAAVEWRLSRDDRAAIDGLLAPG